MNLRQKRDIRRLARQIIQIIFFLWMPALYTSAFSGVRYVIEQIRAGKPIEQNAFLGNADRIMWINHFVWQILLWLCLCIWNLGRWNVCPISMGSEKSKKEASVGIRRNRTETAKNEIYSVISLNADLCIRIYEKVPRNQSLGSIFHVVHR